MEKLFLSHLEKKIHDLREILVENSLDSLYIDNGFPDYYFLDDQPTFFKPNPHFNWFCPDNGQGHVLKIDLKSEKPTLFYYIPDDFWHEVSSLKGEFWEAGFNIEIFNDINSIWKKLNIPGEKAAIISPNSKANKQYELPIVSHQILVSMDWLRSQKTDYEIECIRLANEKASRGHKKARELFFAGASELEIFNQYLLASGQRETEIPYNSIVAFNQGSAILHYQFPKNAGSGKTFLIDAGARYNGYCSDITRTYFTDDVPEVFKHIWQMVEEGQKKQCSMVTPGVEYLDIHREAYNQVAQILVETGLSHVSKEELIEKKIPFAFFPHGIGHPLGLQVHDVGAKQADKGGSPIDQPEDFPYLRTLRTIQENDVLTIEPGFYFIPMLLNDLKVGENKDLLSWDKIETLYSFGGIRIEDNVVASASGPINLTRPFVP